MRGRRATLRLLVVALGLSLPARANPKVLAHAEAQLVEGNFEQTLKLLEPLARRAADPVTLGRVHLLRGQALGALQRPKQALAAFVKALENDPLAELDPAKVNPVLVDLLDQARAQTHGELEVECPLPQVQVRIDGVPAGSAPLRVRVPVGRHQVEGRASSGESMEAEAVVSKGKVATVALSWRAPPAAAPAAPPVATAPVAEPPAPRAAATPAATSAAPVPAARPTWPWASLGAGAAAAGAGAFLFFSAGQRHGALVDPNGPPLAPAEEARMAKEGAAFQMLGAVGVGLGAALVAAGAVGLLRGGSPAQPSGGLALGASPGALWVHGSF